MSENLIELYRYAMDKGADPRVKNLFLMSSPGPTLLIVGIYLLFVTKIGPKLMEKKKPFELKNVLIIYNAIQVILSSYLFYANVKAAVVCKYSFFRCQEVDFSPTNEGALLGLHATYFYFLSKFTEFFDTMFFLLRKKNNQISFLHLFHHSLVPIFSWICVKFIPGGSITLGMATNALVHVIMYSYYFLAGLGSHTQKYLWWKKYLTTIQLIQFVLAMVHIVIILLGDCKTYYKPFIIISFVFIFGLYILFKNFYNTSYKNEDGIKKIKKK